MLQKSTLAHYFCALLRLTKQKKSKTSAVYKFLKGDVDDDDYNNHNDIDVHNHSTGRNVLFISHLL